MAKRNIAVTRGLHRKRQKRFLRACLAGATFTQYNERETSGEPVRPHWRGCWFISLPDYRLKDRGYISGAYKWRHLAVDAALKCMELE